MTRRSRKGELASREFPFRVIVAKDVDAKVRQAGTPRRVRESFVQVYRDASLRGCTAAHYRLSGAGSWPRFCVVRLPDSWRLVISFPDTATVVFLLLERHDNRTDPYAFLEDALGLPDRTGHGAGTTGSKPSCCNDQGEPPLSGEGELAAAIDELVRRGRQ